MSRAQEFNRLARRAKSIQGQRKKLEEQSNALYQELTELEGRADALVREEIGFEPEDLVRDDMGVMYRLTAVSPNSLHWTYSRSKSDGIVSTIKEATNSFHAKGIALNENGLPRWNSDRTIHGALEIYEPEASE